MADFNQIVKMVLPGRLPLNDVELTYDHVEVRDLLIKAAQGIVDETELSAWLRSQSQE